MSDKKNKKPHFLDEYDGEYLGNLWGWKFSYIGLAVILVLSLYVAYSFATNENTPEPTHQEPTISKDSTDVK